MTSARQQVLDSFFDAANDEAISGHAELVQLFVKHRYALLPHTRDGVTRWYVFSTDESDARALRSLVQAFIGPSLSTWNGAEADLHTSQAPEGTVAAVARGPVLRFEPVPGREDSVRDRVRLLAQLMEQKPTVATDRYRASHRVLAELQLAFAAQNDARARDLIDEVAAKGWLSGVNLLFLDLRRRAAMGDFGGILTHPDLPDVLRRRRPRAVTLAIAAAVNAEHLAPWQQRWAAGDSDAPRQALRAFERLSADFQGVFSDAAIETQPDALPGAVTHRIMRAEETEARTLIAGLDETADTGWLEALLAAADAPVSSTEGHSDEQSAPASTTGSAGGQESAATTVEAPPSLRQLYEEQRFAEALAYADEAPSLSGNDLGYAVQAAWNLDNPDAAERAIALIDRASEGTLDRARRDRAVRAAERDLHDLLVAVEESSTAVRSWPEWFTSVAADPTWTGALEVAEHGRMDWSIDTTRDGASELAAAIARCSTDSAAQQAIGGLAHMLPSLAESAQHEPITPVLSTALDLLLYAADATEARDALSVDLFAMLAHRLSPAQVSARMNDFRELWIEVAAPKRVDWPLALTDVAIDVAGRAPAVQEFFAAVVASVAALAQRIDPADLSAIVSIAADLEQEALVAPLREEADPEPGEADDVLAPLAGKLIGIYTLTPGVAHRVTRMMSERCPTATVEVNSDLVSTARLRGLAERADVMVVAFASAKHAATDAIVAVRGRNRVVRALGKGAGGITRGLEAWADAPSTSLQAAM